MPAAKREKKPASTKPSPTAQPVAAPAKFPAFSLAATDGRTWTQADLRGRTTVVYFYPKDATTGCTAEACAFRDAHAALKKRGVQVVGVSPDSLKSHASFIAKQSLPFPLLSDPDHALADALGVWVQKSMYGRTYMGIERSTFLVAPDLSVTRAWRKVSVTGHVDEVAAAATGG